MLASEQKILNEVQWKRESETDFPTHRHILFQWFLTEVPWENISHMQKDEIELENVNVVQRWLVGSLLKALCLIPAAHTQNEVRILLYTISSIYPNRHPPQKKTKHKT